jgi:hypothetical protein
MSLEERRRDLVVSTLESVTINLQKIVDLRFSEAQTRLFFNASTKLNCYQVELFVSAGSVTLGSLVLVSNSSAQRTVYEIGPFPILFLHQVATLTSRLLREVVFISANFEKFNIAIVDRFIAAANGINTIFSDPKFTEMMILPYFLGDVPPHLALQLQYLDGSFSLKYSGLIGTGDLNAPDADMSICEQCREIEGCLRIVVKSLKYLRSDACTWSVPE